MKWSALDSYNNLSNLLLILCSHVLFIFSKLYKSQTHRLTDGEVSGKTERIVMKLGKQ